MRLNLAGKGHAVDGDVTTTGAICIATGAGYSRHGRVVLREGDLTTRCPRCGQVGVVADGVRFFLSCGRRVAMDGALVLCACPTGSNRVVAPLHQAPPARQAMRPAVDSIRQLQPAALLERDTVSAAH